MELPAGGSVRAAIRLRQFQRLAIWTAVHAGRFELRAGLLRAPARRAVLGRRLPRPVRTDQILSDRPADLLCGPPRVETRARRSRRRLGRDGIEHRRAGMAGARSFSAFRSRHSSDRQAQHAEPICRQLSVLRCALPAPVGARSHFEPRALARVAPTRARGPDPHQVCALRYGHRHTPQECARRRHRQRGILSRYARHPDFIAGAGHRHLPLRAAMVARGAAGQ